MLYLEIHNKVFVVITILHAVILKVNKIARKKQSLYHTNQQ